MLKALLICPCTAVSRCEPYRPNDRETEKHKLRFPCGTVHNLATACVLFGENAMWLSPRKMLGNVSRARKQPSIKL